MKKIAVAMSGGVDSSVAAALLLEQGYDVFGITMLVVPESEAVSDKVPALAQKVATQLAIPHYVVDFRVYFKEVIISDFCDQYETGRTPNPCVRCNRFVKFGLLYEKAQDLGADLLATGHYARVVEQGGRYILKKGIDSKRDQSYFLHRLTQEQLSRTMFPLGEITKNAVRLKAKELRLPVSSTESREICFIPDNDYRRFLSTHAAGNRVPGAITDKTGKVLGKHAGISHFTIGQRQGLGIAAKNPLYVIGIDVQNNRIIVGEKPETMTDAMLMNEVNWVSIPEPGTKINSVVKIRYLHPGAAASITPLAGGKVNVKFAEAQSAITPGQSAVFYDGDVVLGGGTIEETAA